MEINKSKSAFDSCVWSPCTQLKDYETLPPLDIVSALGPYLYLKNGERILDGIGSWWCKLLGHRHPKLLAALVHQSEQFEHVMTGYATYDALESLSKRLCDLTQLQKVFYASDGACSVEIALKMACNAKRMSGIAKPKIMTLENSYHGETCGALSVTDLAVFRKGYEELLFHVDVLKDLPYVDGVEDPLFHDCADVWPLYEAQLERAKPDIIIVEPIIQGSAGMLIYSADFLTRLSQWAQLNNAYFIVDEMMTGCGRTGRFFAYQHAAIQPDFVCVGKGLTGGVLALSAVITSQRVFDYFYDDAEKGKTFIHSHTYSGNALAVAVAHACLDELIAGDFVKKTAELTHPLSDLLRSYVPQTARPRVLGAMAAFNVDLPLARPSQALFAQGLKQGILIRPLGSVVYGCLPLNVPLALWDVLFDGALRAVSSLS